MTPHSSDVSGLSFLVFLRATFGSAFPLNVDVLPGFLGIFPSHCQCSVVDVISSSD